MSEQFSLGPIVRPAADELGVGLSDRQVDLLDRLTSELLRWNTRVNLTSIADPGDVAVRHVLDSLTVVPVLRDKGARTLVDVGTGAGFPGLPIAIAEPELRVTLVDATAKKVAFLDHAIEALGLTRVRAVHATAEELGRDPGHRAVYDAAVARAVGAASMLVELLAPLVRRGGQVVLMKKRAAVDSELAAAAPALQALGLVVCRIVDVDLSGLLPGRALIVLRKEKDTTERFPRRPGVARRRPLGIASRS